MCSKIGDLKIKLNEKTAELDTMKQTLERLQGELKEAAGDIAAAKVEVYNVYIHNYVVKPPAWSRI